VQEAVIVKKIKTMQSKIIEKCKHVCNQCTPSIINIFTGIILIILGIIDASRNEYAFAGSWAIFGLMYIAFESGYPCLQKIGTYAGVFLVLALLTYYVYTY